MRATGRSSAGSFRSAPYANPVAAALVTRDVSTGFSAGVAQGLAPALAPPGEPQPFDSHLKDELKLKRSQSETEALLDKFKSDAPAGKRAGILPIHVSFPAFGPSLFLVSELTGENQSPSVILSFQRDKKAGGR